MILQIIEKKKNKQELTKEEINYFINEYVNDNIKDYQISALLMAILLNGMTDEETINLTDAMLHSGEIIDLSIIKGTKIDKHSTGGVGDKTTLILAPLLASCNIKVAKMSGRGLGHTGGTIDKLEAIDNFKTELTQEEFLNQVDQISIALISQSGNIVPADKKLYALRDVTGTVNSIPLIASSIMSKKIASGADKIIIDVKVGKGALVKDLDQARHLSKILKMIGKHYNKETVCVITNMNEPLGLAVGNGLEVIESIECLKGKGPEDLRELVLTLGANGVMISKNIIYEQALEEVTNNLDNGNAYKKFKQMVKYQGGDINKIKLSDNVISVKSKTTGFIKEIDALKIGELSRTLGAGRKNLQDKIDYGVGIVLNRKVGDYILQDEELLKVYVNKIDIPVNDILECFKIEEKFGKKEPLIYGVI